MKKRVYFKVTLPMQADCSFTVPEDMGEKEVKALLSKIVNKELDMVELEGLSFNAAEDTLHDDIEYGLQENNYNFLSASIEDGDDIYEDELKK